MTLWKKQGSDKGRWSAIVETPAAQRPTVSAAPYVPHEANVLTFNKTDTRIFVATSKNTKKSQRSQKNSVSALLAFLQRLLLAARFSDDFWQ